MEKKTYTLNTLLAVVLALALMIALVVKTFMPWVILPLLDGPNVVLLSLIALVADQYLAPGAKRCWWCIALASAATFALLPLAAGFVDLQGAGYLAVLGGAVFTAVTWAYTSIADRLSSGPSAKAAPIVNAFGIYLASQCLMGLF